MKDIEPEVFRQRALVEAKVGINITENVVKEYLSSLVKHLKLRSYGGPIVYFTGGVGKEINQGFDGFIALIDSGISI